MGIDFQSIRAAQKALHDYYFYQHWLYGNSNDDLCQVAIRRIEQVVLILKNIDSRVKLRGAAGKNWLDELEIYVEAFYWFAWSAARMLDAHASHMKREKLVVPRFKNFQKEVAGVCIVRNKMIEHADEKKGVLVGGLNVLDSGDVIVKYEEPWVRSVTGEPPHSDPGLFANVDEFFTKLKQRSEESSKPLVARGAKIIRKTPSSTPL